MILNASRQELTCAFIQEAENTELMESISAHYGDYLFKIIKNSLKDNDKACDCFQYLLTHLADDNCRRIRMFKGNSSFKTYLVCICQNVIVDYLRKDKNNNKVEYVELSELDMMNTACDATPEDDLIDMEKNEKIKEIMQAINSMDSLNNHERIVIKLRIWKSRTYDEINRMTHDKNSAYTLKRALAKIRNNLDSRLIDDYYTLILE